MHVYTIINCLNLKFHCDLYYLTVIYSPMMEGIHIPYIHTLLVRIGEHIKIHKCKERILQRK